MGNLSAHIWPIWQLSAPFSGSLACTHSPASIGIIILIRRWPLSTPKQQALLLLAQQQEVRELILVGRQLQKLPLAQMREPKLPSILLHAASQAQLTEAGVFETHAEAIKGAKAWTPFTTPASAAVAACIGCDASLPTTNSVAQIA